MREDSPFPADGVFFAFLLYGNIDIALVVRAAAGALLLAV
jgi:hypothetical protein